MRRVFWLSLIAAAAIVAVCITVYAVVVDLPPSKPSGVIAPITGNVHPCETMHSRPTVESLPPHEIAGNCVQFFVTSKPIWITTNTLAGRQQQQQQNSNVTLMFRFFNPINNHNFPHTTFRLTIIHFVDNKTIFQDVFHSHTGNLTLNIYRENETTQQNGIGVDSRSNYRVSSLQNAIIVGNDNTINVSGPIFVDPGAYHIILVLLGINNDTLLPNYNSYNNNSSGSDLATNYIFNQTILSIATTYNKTISYHSNQSYAVSAISYYDKLTDFGFDQSNNSFHFSMPFNWNPTFIKNNDIFVHEDLRIPKSFVEFLGKEALSSSFSRFNATVNDIPINGRNLAVDPYNHPDSVVFHYLLSKDDLVSMSKIIQDRSSNSNDNTATMTFTLSHAH